LQLLSNGSQPWFTRMSHQLLLPLHQAIQFWFLCKSPLLLHHHSNGSQARILRRSHQFQKLLHQASQQFPGIIHDPAGMLLMANTFIISNLPFVKI